jgi:hypothetical protein
VPGYTPDQWVVALDKQLRAQAQDAQRWSRYYEGTQPMSYMAPELAKEIGDRIRPVVLNWPRLVVDSLEERLDVEGFRYGPDATADARLWEWWQANDMDEQSQMGHVDSLAAARSFVIVGAGDDAATPVITVESPEQVTVDFDPRTRLIRAAWKSWTDRAAGYDFGTLYLPDRTATYFRDTAAVRTSAGAGWSEVDVDEHRMGRVPVVPLVNRPRVLAPLGVSELVDVVPLSDAACKVATDMMVSAEFHAMPRRWVVGMTEEDFRDAQGNKISEWSKVAGRIWASGALPSEVQIGQFPEANLSNFHETINSLAKLVASMAGLPAHALGMATDNPASADAIRSSEARLVKRAERRQRSFGGAWEQVMRLCLLVVDGDVPAESRSLATVWRDAATPTVAQKADAAVKTFQAGISTRRQAREDYGYSASQIARMETEDGDAVSRILAGDLESLTGPKPMVAAPDAVAG